MVAIHNDSESVRAISFIMPCFRYCKPSFDVRDISQVMQFCFFFIINMSVRAIMTPQVMDIIDVYELNLYC